MHEISILDTSVLVIAIVSVLVLIISLYFEYFWYGIIFFIIVLFCWIKIIKIPAYVVVLALIFAIAGFIEILIGKYLYAIFLLIIAGTSYFLPQIIKEDEESEKNNQGKHMPAIEHSPEEYNISRE